MLLLDVRVPEAEEQGQSKLEEVDAKSRQQQQQQRKGQAFAKAKEALRHAVNICLQKGETSLADTDAQFILEAVMDGSLAINVGFTSTAPEKAEVITASIVAYFKSKRF